MASSYHPNGRVKWSDLTGNAFHDNGVQAFSKLTGNAFHINRVQAYNRLTGNAYHENRVLAYSRLTGKFYDNQGIQQKSNDFSFSLGTGITMQILPSVKITVYDRKVSEL